MVGKNSKALDYYKKTFMISQKFHRREVLIRVCIISAGFISKKKNIKKQKSIFANLLPWSKKGIYSMKGLPFCVSVRLRC